MHAAEKAHNMFAICITGIVFGILTFTQPVAASEAKVNLFKAPDMTHYCALQRAAILGLETMAVAELIDEPQELFTPAAQKFIDHAFFDVSLTLPANEDRANLQSIRERLRGPRDFAHDAVLHAFEIITLASMQATDSASSPGLVDSRVFSGNIQQTGFNARTFHDPKIDSGLRRLISRSALLDQVVPGLAAEREALGALQEGDWIAASDIASQIAQSILAMPGKDIAADTTLAITLNVTKVTSSGIRYGSLRVFADLIHADGSVETIGGYPGTSDDFSEKNVRVMCGVNREAKRSRQVHDEYSMTALDEWNMTVLAERFQTKCRNFNEYSKKYPLAYDPMGVSGTNDNSFFFSLLRSIGRQNDVEALQRREGAR